MYSEVLGSVEKKLSVLGLPDLIVQTTNSTRDFVSSLQFVPAGDAYVFGTYDGGLYKAFGLNGEARKLARMSPARNAVVDGLSVNPDGKLLAAIFRRLGGPTLEASLVIRSIDDGHMIGVMPGRADLGPRQTAWDPQGRSLFAPGETRSFYGTGIMGQKL